MVGLQELGVSKKVMTRQTSCPQPLVRRLSSFDLHDLDEGTPPERRRVRMIHRH
jgi:hypothetical protein